MKLPKNIILTKTASGYQGEILPLSVCQRDFSETSGKATCQKQQKKAKSNHQVGL